MRAALPPPERQEHGRLLVVVNLTVVKYLPPVWQEPGTPAGSSTVSGVVSPFVGMAGRHTASPIPHASPGGEGVLSDMAGSPRPTAGSSRSSRAAPPPGTAGTVSAAGHEAHSVTSGASPSGTAGTRRPGGTGRTPAKAQTPPGRNGRDGSAKSRRPSRCKPRHQAYERRYAADTGRNGKVSKNQEEKE